MTYIQSKLFDGYTVDTQRASIGAFDIEEVDTEHYRADQVLVLVAVATVTGASFGANKNGDWTRTNKLSASQVHVATGAFRTEIVEMFNLAGDELPFPPHPVAEAEEEPGDEASTDVDDDDLDAEEAVEDAAKVSV